MQVYSENVSTSLKRWRKAYERYQRASGTDAAASTELSQASASLFAALEDETVRGDLAAVVRMTAEGGQQA